LYRLLGGASKPIKAYAGGISLGWQPPESLAQEALGYIARGYRAIKLRVGDNPRDDVARATAVREAVGDSIEILVDANTNYTLDDVRRVMPAYDELQIGWLEEPFPAQDYRSYQTATSLGTTPLAAGENHYTRFEFIRLIEDGAISFVQPDLSKTGGVTETMRIAAMASAWKLPFNPHTSATGINMAATINVLASVDVPGYFEGDVARNNPFRDEVGGVPYALDADGCVKPSETVGLGVEINEAFINGHPLSRDHVMSEPQRAEIAASAMRLVHVASRALLLLLIGASSVLAQVASTADPDNYPNKTIRYIVPLSTGRVQRHAGPDLCAKASGGMGVPVVVENRPGGGTLIAPIPSPRPRRMATPCSAWRSRSARTPASTRVCPTTP